MKTKQPLCLALGMGAIGKAVSGYAMTKAGVHVTFADIADDQIEKVNREVGYWLGTADIYTKTLTKAFITNVDAVHINSQAATDAAMQAEYIISAVGPKGFRALLERITGWFLQRNTENPRPLYFMVFENDSQAMTLLHEAVEQAFGTQPQWLHLAKCSIERMTKVAHLPQVGMIPVGETFLPIIADGKAMEGCGIYDRDDVLQVADDVQKYYYRKLLTNNLGHAVLGYAGLAKGYKTTVEAFADPEIYDLLQRTVAQSGQAVCRKWGFTQQEMEKHLQTLMLRFGNPCFADDLERLARDPLRKLSPMERIVYPINLCQEYGLEHSGLLRTLLYALKDQDPELAELRSKMGLEGILKTVCEASPRLLADVMELANI